MADNITLNEVAAKRGRQTLAISLGVDVLVALAIVLGAVVGDLNSWQQLIEEASFWSFLLFKSVIQAVVAWVVRRWVDQSGFSNSVAPDGARRAITEED